MRLRPTNQNRLHKVEIKSGGRTLTLDAQVRAGAQVSLAHDQVNQLTMSLADDEVMSLWKNGGIAKGTTLVYDGRLRFEVRGYSIDPNAGSIGLTVRSQGTAKLKDARGAKNWGEQDVTQWLSARFREAGLTPVVQPGLGRRKFQRQKGDQGQDQESTWDVMTKARDELGLWLFEAGGYGIAARPRWIEKNQPSPINLWTFWWNASNDYVASLAGSPTYEYSADSEPHEKMSLKLVSADADQAKPGDIVRVTGSYREVARAQWIIQSVTIPLASDAPVDVSCVRIHDPKPEKK